MTFESVNEQNQIPRKSEKLYTKRNVFKFVVKTWLDTQDSNWFDTEEVYKMIEPDLIRKLKSESTGQKQELLSEYFFFHTFNLVLFGATF